MKKILKSGQKKDTLEIIQMIIDSLKNSKSLPEKYKVHSLSGPYNHCNECHIFPDLLLIYTHDHKGQVLELIRIGSQSDLFQ